MHTFRAATSIWGRVTLTPRAPPEMNSDTHQDRPKLPRAESRDLDTELAWIQTSVQAPPFLTAPPTAASSEPRLGPECSELTVCSFQVIHGFLSPQRPPSTDMVLANHTLTDATKLQVTQRWLSKQCQATAQNSLTLRSNEPCPAQATSS